MRLNVFNGSKLPEYDPVFLIGVLWVRFSIVDIDQGRSEQRPWNVVHSINKSHWTVLPSYSRYEIEIHVKTSLRRICLWVTTELIRHCLIDRRWFLDGCWRHNDLFLRECRSDSSALISDALDCFLPWWRGLCLYIGRRWLIGRRLYFLLLYRRVLLFIIGRFGL